jgi:hypothetical protein
MIEGKALPSVVQPGRSGVFWGRQRLEDLRDKRQQFLA